MAKYTLNIETDDAAELRDIVDRIAGEPVRAVAPQITDAVTQAAPEKPAAPKPGKAKPAPKVESAGETPLSSSDAPDVSSPSTAHEPASVTTAATATTTGEKISPPAADVSYDAVKQALITLMDKKSASVVQGLLKEKFGVVAISQLDKTRYAEALEALNAWAAE